MRLHRLPLSHLVQPITEGPMGPECGLGLERGIPTSPDSWVSALSVRGSYSGQACQTHGCAGLAQLLGRGTEWRCLQTAILTPGALLPDTGRRGMRIAADRCAKSQERGNVAKAHGQWLPG